MPTRVDVHNAKQRTPHPQLHQNQNVLQTKTLHYRQISESKIRKRNCVPAVLDITDAQEDLLEAEGMEGRGFVQIFARAEKEEKAERHQPVEGFVRVGGFLTTREF